MGHPTSAIASTAAGPETSRFENGVRGYRRFLFVGGILHLAQPVLYVMHPDGDVWRVPHALAFAAMMFVLAYNTRPRLVVEIGPRWILAPQDRPGSPAVQEWGDLTGLAWFDPKAPTFTTRQGRRFLLDLAGLRRKDRRRVHELLAERLPFYRDRLAASAGRPALSPQAVRTA